MLEAVQQCFFASFRVSVLFDANGCNTTASAAVLAALEASGGSMDGAKVAVLAGTGPVGQRVARLLSRLGAEVRVGSRDLHKAQSTADVIALSTGKPLSGFSTATEDELIQGLSGISIAIAAGAAGVALLSDSARQSLPDLKAAIDLNAVPPAGDRRRQAHRSRYRP